MLATDPVLRFRRRSEMPAATSTTATMAPTTIQNMTAIMAELKFR